MRSLSAPVVVNSARGAKRAVVADAGQQCVLAQECVDGATHIARVLLRRRARATGEVLCRCDRIGGLGELRGLRAETRRVRLRAHDGAVEQLAWLGAVDKLGCLG